MVADRWQRYLYHVEMEGPVKFPLSVLISYDDELGRSFLHMFPGACCVPSTGGTKINVAKTVSSVASHRRLREGMLSKIGINFY